MAREWTDLFILDEARARVAAASQAQEPEKRGRFFKRLRHNLRKTREALGAELTHHLGYAPGAAKPAELAAAS